MINLLSKLFAAKQLDFPCSKCGTLNTVKLDDSEDSEYETDESTSETGDNDPDNDGDDDTETELDSMKNTPKHATPEQLAKSLLASASKSKSEQIKADRAGKPTNATKLARKLNVPADNTALETLANAIKKARGAR